MPRILSIAAVEGAATLRRKYWVDRTEGGENRQRERKFSVSRSIESDGRSDTTHVPSLECDAV